MNFEEFIHPECKEPSHKGAQCGFAVLSHLSQPDCPNVLVWRSAGTSICWEQICEHHTRGNSCHYHPRSFSFRLHPGSLKIGELVQSHRRRRLTHSLLLWLLLLYKFIEFCLMQRTQFCITVAEPGDLPVLWGVFMHVPQLRGSSTCYPQTSRWLPLRVGVATNNRWHSPQQKEEVGGDQAAAWQDSCSVKLMADAGVMQLTAFKQAVHWHSHIVFLSFFQVEVYILSIHIYLWCAFS